MLSSCLSNKQFLCFDKIIQENINHKEIKLIKGDLMYQNWINESLNKKYILKYGISITDTTISDTLFVREYYSDNIYFKGKVLKQYKFGYWEGYYKNILIIKTAYVGNEPAFVRLSDKNGKIKKNYTFSIIK